MNVEAVSNVMSSRVGATSKASETGVVNTNLLSQNAPQDSVNFKGRSAEMSDLEKQELILKARTKAAGWAFWGGPISTLYYGLRPDATIAQKYNLDPVKDKDLVKRIKKEQCCWTLPATAAVIASLISGGAALSISSFLFRAVTYLYNKCMVQPKDIEL